MHFRKLAPTDPVPRIDHVLVVKLAPNRFEVSATAGGKKKHREEAEYLAATAHATQDSAIAQAEAFAKEHGLKTIHVKGFTPHDMAA